MFYTEVSPYRKPLKSFANGNCVLIGAFAKSSYSQGASNCIAVGEFAKSSHSMNNGGCLQAGEFAKSSYCPHLDCLQAGEFHAPERVVRVQDTKEDHLGDGRTTLEFSAAAWAGFIAHIK